MAQVSLTNIVKDYGKTRVIHGVDLTINTGEFVVFVGPSGCGKSTLLRMIAGLENITGGDLTIGDEIVNDVVPAERGVAMVFQSYALYPHMTVFENMAFGLKQAKTPRDEINRRVRNAADALQVTSYLDRLPKHLSGGQRQRVAIGRAIVREPKVFLFDEPLSNLDASLRVQTRIEIARLHAELDATMVYVTHDQVEAMTLADRIVVLNDGRIEQVGSPLELYNNPANRFVAEFIGSPKMNIVPCADAVNSHSPAFSKMAEQKKAAALGIRPEHLEETTKARALLRGSIRHIEQLGEYSLAYVMTENETEIITKLAGDSVLGVGSEINLSAATEKIHFFDDQDMVLG